MTNSEWIYSVVDKFYAKARYDVLIGYHFRHITDFETHIPRIAQFWEMQLLGTLSRPITHPFDMLGVHLPLGIKPGELGRWLLLFRQTLNETTPPEKDLIEKWEEKLKFFESVLSRALGL